MRTIRRMLVGFVLSIAVGPSGEAVACPNCKEAVASQDGGAARLADGYSWSILLMIAMPFALLGTGTLMVARAARRGGFPEL